MHARGACGEFISEIMAAVAVAVPVAMSGSSFNQIFLMILMACICKEAKTKEVSRLARDFSSLQQTILYIRSHQVTPFTSITSITSITQLYQLHHQALLHRANAIFAISAQHD